MALRTTAGSAGNSVTTDTDVMMTAAQYVNSVADTMISQFNTLLTRLEGVRWTSGAATAFQQAQLNWNAAATNLRNVLTEIAEGLDNTRRTYDRTDEDNQLGITQAVQGLTY